MKKAKDVSEYISFFPKHTQTLLKQVRKVVKDAAPDAVEVISYGMPAYKLDKMLLYFAAFEKHIGFYPMASAIVEFKEEIAGFKSAKGSIQFPIGKPLPIKLMTKIVKFRVKENLQRIKGKNAKKNI